MIKPPQLSEKDIKQMFKTSHYKCIPIEYINYIRVLYDDNVVKRYNRAQISNKIDSLDRNYAKIFQLYNDTNVKEINIEIRFDKIAVDSTEKVNSWFKEALEDLK